MLELIINAKRFQDELNAKIDDKDRFLSWVHCYRKFSEYFRKDSLSEEDVDYLSLHLAFYLASWGMYRGSSFLLQRDYTIHKETVKLLFDYKYLNGLTCNKLPDNLVDIKELSNKINEVYIKDYQNIHKERSKLKNNQSPKKITDTLTTKILMGTLGCSPAYDRYFIDGLKRYSKICKTTFSINSLQELITLYHNNYTILEDFRNEVSAVYDVDYPQMKLLDLIFWYHGYNN